MLSCYQKYQIQQNNLKKSGQPVRFEFQINKEQSFFSVCLMQQQLFLVCLKFKFNWVSCVSSGNSTGFTLCLYFEGPKSDGWMQAGQDVGIVAGKKGEHLAQPPSAPLSFNCWLHTPQALDRPHLESSLRQGSRLARWHKPCSCSVHLTLGSSWSLACQTSGMHAALPLALWQRDSHQPIQLLNRIPTSPNSHSSLCQ